jgi:hypothetical protein
LALADGELVDATETGMKQASATVATLRCPRRPRRRNKENNSYQDESAARTFFMAHGCQARREARRQQHDHHTWSAFPTPQGH